MVSSTAHTSPSTRPWYQRAYRRMLVDMHIPDWDSEFLANYDPATMAEMYVRAGVESVMFYCQSHVGLCYWPTQSGKMHAGLHGRDVVGEMLAHLRSRHLAACAYYSVIYNNWAFLEHPEWRMVPPAKGGDAKNALAFAGSRYGFCCPNNPGYLQFIETQMAELLGGYQFDGLFYDMTFWPTICLCSHCRAQYREETGAEIPEIIDWWSPAWTQFVNARERWMTEFAGTLTRCAKRFQPELAVYHNFATAIFNWTLGLVSDSAVHHDFLGADFYEDHTETLLVNKLMMNLTEHRPLEFMTSRCVDLVDHERTKSHAQMEMQAYASTLFSSAFMFIDAVNPDGSVLPAVYERIGKIYQDTARYEPYLGGEQVEEIAVYFSSASRVSFAENGSPISDAPFWSKDYPHLKAVRGACRVLQQSHLPFGVITKKQLESLQRYKVIILPNLLRMDATEVSAFREYVRQGGKLYASRYTSLTGTDGQRYDDFQLADVFGCHLADDDLGNVTYLNPQDDAIAACISPQRCLSHFAKPGSSVAGAGMLRLAAQAEGCVLATLTVPYAKEWGSVFDQQWTSIHSSPPWQCTDAPAIVRHSYGDGEVIYAAADLESIPSEANDQLFHYLIMQLLDEQPVYTADTHPAVWMSVAHQPEHNRYLVGFLNYQTDLPAIPISRIPFTLRLPEGTRVKRVSILPDEQPIDFSVDADGVLHAMVSKLQIIQMLLVEYV